MDNRNFWKKQICPKFQVSAKRRMTQTFKKLEKYVRKWSVQKCLVQEFGVRIFLHLM